MNAEKRKPWVRKGAVCAEKRKPWVRKDPLNAEKRKPWIRKGAVCDAKGLNAEKRKPWIRKGAVCECHGEGKGNLFVIEALKGNCAWLVSLRPIYGAKARYPLGWKELKGCYRSDKARRAERALDP